MTTDLVVVADSDPVELVANLMDWHKIRQVLVEDGEHRLVGLVSYRTILRLVARGASTDLGSLSVADVMRRDPVCVPPDMPPIRALEVMRSFGIGASRWSSIGNSSASSPSTIMNVAGLLLNNSTPAERKPAVRRLTAAASEHPWASIVQHVTFRDHGWGSSSGPWGSPRSGISAMGTTTPSQRVLRPWARKSRSRDSWWAGLIGGASGNSSGMNATVLWIIAAILVVVGVVQLLQGQIILGIVLIIAACLVGPGGYSVFHRRA
jgi:hypothetical protein